MATVGSTAINEGVDTFSHAFDSLDLNAIKSYPTASKPLRAFRRVCKSKGFKLGAPSSSYSVADVLSKKAIEVGNTLMIELIAILISQPASRIIGRRSLSRELSRELLDMLRLADAYWLSVASVAPTIGYIVENKPGGPTWNDVDFWRIVVVTASREFSRAYSTPRSLGESKSTPAYLTASGIRATTTAGSTSMRKRKRNEELVEGNSAKRSKSSNRGLVNAKNSEPHVTGHHSIQEAKPDSLAACESET